MTAGCLLRQPAHYLDVRMGRPDQASNDLLDQVPWLVVAQNLAVEPAIDRLVCSATNDPATIQSTQVLER